MARRKLIHLAGFGVIVLTICLTHGQELISNEAEARNFLNQTSDEMFTFFNELTDKEYYFDIDTQRNQYKTNQNYINFVNQIVEDSRKFDFENFNDKELKYAFKILVKIADENIIGVNRSTKVLESLKELDYLPHYKEIYKYDPRNALLVYSPDVEEIIAKSANEDEIQHYWGSWRKMTGKWAKENLNLMIEELKEAASLSELTPLEFWSKGFNITDMEALVWEIQPFYRELHTFVRKLIRKKFGSSAIKRNRLIPAHLYDQVQLQLMTNESIIEELFPYGNLPKFETEGNKAMGLYENAEGFYEELGFESYSRSLWLKHKKSLQTDDSGSKVDPDGDDVEECQTRVIYKTPNPYLYFCDNMSFRDFLDAYINLGFIHYAKEMVGLPAYFFSAPQGLDYAIGKAVVLSASTQNNLRKLGWIDDVALPENVEMSQLLRMALNRIFYLPLDFVHAKVMADLLSGKVAMSGLKNHYWNLLSTYAGVNKPEWHESDDTFDFPVKFYKQINKNLMSRDFTMEILSYQIHKKLCEISGKYPKESLHLCDIGESKEAGNALKKLMRLGCSKPFYQVLGSLFPVNPKISAEGLLEFYKPVNRMVSRRNKEANLKVGWEATLLRT